MANLEHLKILKQGVEVWNRWREVKPDLIPDLTDVRLSDTNFGSKVYIKQVEQANYQHINFSKTLLCRSVLRGANLCNAFLRAANFREADCRRTDFRGADLTRAVLHQTNLTLAILSEANLNEAIFWETILARTNFHGAKSLESCRHGGPSIIDHRTLQRSGRLPLEFLRGCGLPDDLIEYLTSAKRLKRAYYTCFISYSSKDQSFADKLYADLQSRSVRCWFAPKDLKIGAEIRTSIDESIYLHDKLLLVLSETSINSQWVQQEVETALAKEREQGRTVLFPLRLDDAVMQINSGWPAYLKNTRNIGDFTRWSDHDSYQQAFDRLLRDLKAEVK